MKSPITRVGGKFRMTGRLLELLPPHETYIEPFFGAGHLFFAKERSRLEVINDLDGEVMNFYRVVAYHSAELEAWLRFLPHSRQTWEELERQPELTDIQRAVCGIGKTASASEEGVRPSVSTGRQERS